MDKKSRSLTIVAAFAFSIMPLVGSSISQLSEAKQVKNAGPKSGSDLAGLVLQLTR